MLVAAFSVRFHEDYFFRVVVTPSHSGDLIDRLPLEAELLDSLLLDLRYIAPFRSMSRFSSVLLCTSLYFGFSGHFHFFIAVFQRIDLKKSLPYLNRQACPPFCALSSLNFFPCRRLVFFPPFAAASDKKSWNGTAPFSLDSRHLFVRHRTL